MFFVAATLVLAAAGCSKEDAGVANGDVQYVSELTINFEGDSRVNATHSEAGLKFAWADGDQIVICKNAPSSGTRLIYQYDETSDSFKAIESSGQLEAGVEYFAIYTKSAYLVQHDGTQFKVTTKLDDSNNSNGVSGIPMISDIFTATTDGTIATMHHLCGVVEVPVKLDAESAVSKINQLSLFVAKDVKLAGSFYATPQSPYFLEKTADAYYFAYSKKEETTLNSTTATSIFIPVLPGTYANPKINYFYTHSSDGSSSSQRSLTGTLTVTRGKLVKVPEITVTLY